MWCEQATIGVPVIYSRVVGTNHPLSPKLFLSGKGAPHVMKHCPWKHWPFGRVCSCSCSCSRDSATKRTYAILTKSFTYLRRTVRTEFAFESCPIKLLMSPTKCSKCYSYPKATSIVISCWQDKQDDVAERKSSGRQQRDRFSAMLKIENWVNLWSIKSIKSCESCS